MGKDKSPTMDTDNARSKSSTETPTSEDFRILEVTNDGLYNLSISAPLSSTPLFYVTNTYFTFGKPSIVLTSQTKDGIVLGFMKIAWKGKDTVGLGEPDAADTTYEELRPMSKWSETRHELDFGPRGERRTFVWVRTKARYMGDQPDLELREKLVGSADADEEGRGLGEVLGVYKGCQGLMSKMRGTFYLRKHEGEAEGEEFWRRGKSAECSDWDLIVLLTACGLIEEGRRRARARYVGASNVS